MRVSTAILFALVAGCDSGPPDGPQYFERVIQPILTTNCVRNQGACHLDDGKGNALGNLDLSSYAAVTRRRDVLRTYGSYPLPLLLLKASGAAVPPIPYKGAKGGMTVSYPSEIQHAGGSTISVQSNSFFELQKWLSDGAAEDGSVVIKPQQMGTGPCNPNFMALRPDVAAQLSTVDTNSQPFKDFVNNVEPILTQSCAFGTCHSGEQSDFFLTCNGQGGDASKFNFLEAQSVVGAPPETSLLLIKPLAPNQGGIGHTGGAFFQSQMDSNWIAFKTWATEVGVSTSATPLSTGEQFFRDNVMPVFLRRGCALEACHSPGSANDFKLRAGTQGFFTTFMLSTNYKEARQFLVPDVPDVRQGRLVRKPVRSVAEGGIGLTHRGGPPLESMGDPPGLDPTKCPQPWTTASTPFCTIVEWHRLERQALLAAQQADNLAAGDQLPVIVVTRPPNADRLVEFDTFEGNADLIEGHFTVGALGAIDPASGVTGPSLIGGCKDAGGNPIGASRTNVDVRRPTVAYDGSKVAFAMRLGASDTLDIYEVTLDAAHTCTKVTSGNGAAPNGIKLHNLDPMYAPDGTLVFASTRGKNGPTLSLKYLLPQTDLWRMAPQAGGGYAAPEQMTALLGSELSPNMMLNGQVTFTAEKASADFYQLSGRRINWDLTDYHPLLAQRSQSIGIDGMMHPSVDYQQATEIREGIDRNFMLVFSDEAARGGGGALALFNRSIGPFEADRTDITFLHSVTVIDAGATRGGTGAYRSPASLPDGTILVSYASGVTDLTATTPIRFDLAVVDPKTGGRTTVPGLSGGGISWLEAVPAYKREPRTEFRNLTQLVFGGHGQGTDMGHGVVHYPDLPMLGTLLGANLRTGRFVDKLRTASKLVVYQDTGPTSVQQGMSMQTGMEHVYQNRMPLGSAGLASDGSVQVQLPSLTPLILELQDQGGNKLFTMTEEDQLGPGEYISRGVPQQFFNSVCGGCHGSVSGIELEIAINPDALTGASVSLSRDPSSKQVIGP
jgi:hypothetical protein